MTPQELRQWREARKLSPGELADGLMVTRKTVYRWEKGQVAIPADLEHRLTGYTVAREHADTAKPVAPAWSEDDDSSTETPHGQVIGLQRFFWREWSDAQRIAWIMDPKNVPHRALPWPLWSHGWSFYPPVSKTGARAQPLPHYLSKWAVRALKHRMDQAKGTEQERLRAAVISLCRRCAPTWPLDSVSIGISDEAMQSLDEIARQAGLPAQENG